RLRARAAVLLGGSRARHAARVPELPVTTLARVLIDGVARDADATALVDGARRWTYPTLARRAAALRDALFERNVRRGDVVALCLPNCADFVAAHYAALSLGAVVAPLPIELRGARRQRALRLVRPAVLVADTERRARAFATEARAVLAAESVR